MQRDKDRDFAPESSVMTLSLGGARRFQLQHGTTKETLLLEHGPLFVLGPKTNGKHSILKGTKREHCETRLGLTYRHFAIDTVRGRRK